MQDFETADSVWDVWQKVSEAEKVFLNSLTEKNFIEPVSYLGKLSGKVYSSI